MSLVVQKTKVVDTDHGCGGSLRVVIYCEDTEQTRTIDLDLAEIYFRDSEKRSS